MKQFDVVANPDAQSTAFAPFLLVLSSHRINLDVTVIAPLLRGTPAGEGILVPVTFGGLPYFVSVGELATMPPQRLRQVVGSLAEEEDAIRRAVDRLFTGF